MKKIIFFTGNRADYWLQKELIMKTISSKIYKVRILVSGSHLEKKYGETYQILKLDGFKKILDIEKIASPKVNNSSTGIVIADAIKKYSLYLEKHKPDLFIVPSDRFEAFAALVAATQKNILTAHFEGGDITEGGCYDDSVRHAMTKLSHYHFVTNTKAKTNLIKMGEEKDRIFLIGLPSLDIIKQKNYTNHIEICKKYNLNKNKPIILFTFHPIASLNEKNQTLINSLEKVIKHLNKEFDIIATYPNNDAGSEYIIHAISKWSKNYKNFQLYKSLGAYDYYGILALNLKNFKVICLGNSSSGIKETAIFKCPTINLGNRQDGRLKPNNIIDIPKLNYQKIITTISFILENKNFNKTLKNINNPYYFGGAKKQFLKGIKTALRKNSTNKKHVF